MHSGELPEDIATFLHDHIESYEQLELLLLLRNEQQVSWTEEGLSRRLRIPASLIGAALAHLEHAGYVSITTPDAEKRYSYLAQNDELEATMARLAQTYREQPMPIIKLMSANAIERVRTAALRTFADAFILRKDKPRG